MKRFHRRYPLLTSFILFFGVLVICAWQNPTAKNLLSQFRNNNQADTIPNDKNENKSFYIEDYNNALKNLNINIEKLNEQIKNINVNVDKEVQESLAKTDYEKVIKDAEALIKTIDWQNMQKEIQDAQYEIAKVDFTKMQNEMKAMQEKFQSDEFKQQLNTEKIQQQVKDALEKSKDAMAKTKLDMEKAKEKMQHIKDFIDALAADNLIDKKKGFTVEWKGGRLFINGKEQSKEIADKYRKYEDAGKIKMIPEGAEQF